MFRFGRGAFAYVVAVFITERMGLNVSRWRLEKQIMGVECVSFKAHLLVLFSYKSMN